jgi:hypothetical protein
MESIYQNCETVVRSYLLYQNPFYVYSFPIALIVAIVVYGICQSSKWCQNSYMSQIIIPFITIFVVIWIIDAVSKSMLDTRKVDELMGVCTQALSKVGADEHFTERMEGGDGPTPTPSPNAPAQMAPNVQVAIAYQDKLEDAGELRSPLNEIDDLYNSTVSVINPDTTPYSLPYNGLNTLSEAPLK